MEKVISSTLILSAALLISFSFPLNVDAQGGGQKMEKSSISNEPTYTILDPRSREPEVKYQGLNPRLDTLDGKKVMVVNLHGGNEEVMEALATDLQAAVPACNVEYYAVKGKWSNLEPEDWEKMLSGDAVILGHNY